MKRLFRILRVLHFRTETHIKIGVPIFAGICVLAASLLYKLSQVTHVTFAY